LLNPVDRAFRPDPRGCDLPTCPVCADTMVAAEASAYLNDHVISYLWTCDTCGYGFVTKHSVKRFACNWIPQTIVEPCHRAPGRRAFVFECFKNTIDHATSEI
jgi:hypothetical protein